MLFNQLALVNSVFSQNILNMRPKEVFLYFNIKLNSIVIEQEETSKVKIVCKIDDYQYQVYEGYKGRQGIEIKDTTSYIYDHCKNIDSIIENGKVKSVYINTYSEGDDCLLLKQFEYHYVSSLRNSSDSILHKFSYENGRMVSLYREKLGSLSNITKKYNYKDDLLSCATEMTVNKYNNYNDTIVSSYLYLYDKEGWIILQECQPNRPFKKRSKIVKYDNANRAVKINISDTGGYYPMEILYSNFDGQELPAKLIRGRGKNRTTYNITYK
jgi:hypothetical protein